MGLRMFGFKDEKKIFDELEKDVNELKVSTLTNCFFKMLPPPPKRAHGHETVESEMKVTRKRGGKGMVVGLIALQPHHQLHVKPCWSPRANTKRII